MKRELLNMHTSKIDGVKPGELGIFDDENASVQHYLKHELLMDKDSAKGHTVNSLAVKAAAADTEAMRVSLDEMRVELHAAKAKLRLAEGSLETTQEQLARCKNELASVMSQRDAATARLEKVLMSIKSKTRAEKGDTSPSDPSQK